MVLARETHSAHTEDADLLTQAGSYWVAHNGRLLLIAPQHIRAVTNEERLSAAVMTQVVADIRAELEDTRGNVVFEDLRPADEQAASPEVEPPDVVELPPAVVEAPAARSRRGSGQEPDAERTPSVTSVAEAPIQPPEGHLQSGEAEEEAGPSPKV